MNHEQRRAFIHYAKMRGVKASDARAYADIIRNGFTQNTPAKEWEEGQKVKLDVEAIKARKNYSLMNKHYREFVESNPDTVFTAHIERPNMISLSENPQWIFWSGDLLKYVGDD